MSLSSGIREAKDVAEHSLDEYRRPFEDFDSNDVCALKTHLDFIRMDSFFISAETENHTTGSAACSVSRYAF